MKISLIKKNYSFILLISGMFFITGSNVMAQCGPCSGSNKVRITKETGCSYAGCETCRTKCVPEDQLQRYYDQGWTFGGGCRGKQGCGGNSAVDLNKANTEATSIFIYPDPVSNSTTISFTLKQSEKISLKIYNNAGRVVKVFADALMLAGDREFEWNMENMNEGVYMLRLQTSFYDITKKLIVSK